MYSQMFSRLNKMRFFSLKNKKRVKNKEKEKINLVTRPSIMSERTVRNVPLIFRYIDGHVDVCAREEEDAWAAGR